MDSLQNSPKLKKWLKGAAWTVGGVLALWAVAWLAVPPIVKSQLQKIASEKLGRQITVGEIQFKPWTLELTLKDLAVAKSSGGEPQLRVASIYIDAELQSLVRLAPVIDAITVEAPQIYLTRTGDGHYDIDDLIAKFTSDTEPSDPNKAPARFALYNLKLDGGEITFDDKPAGRVHELKNLVVSLPFLSSFESSREVAVEPRLAFVLNGSEFDSAAQTMPFAQTRKTDASLSVHGLDLAPYLQYLPKDLPVQLKAGLLSTDIKFAFQKSTSNTASTLSLTGTLSASKVRIDQASTGEIVSFDTLDLALADVRPLEKKVHLSKAELVAPKISLLRRADGSLALPGQKTAGSTPAVAAKPATIASAAATAASAAASAATAASAKPAADAWNIAVDAIALRDGTVSWVDESTKPVAKSSIDSLVVDVADLTFPFTKPIKLSGNANVGAAAKGTKPSTFKFEGQFDGSKGQSQASIKAWADKLPLDIAAPYLAAFLGPRLKGTLSSDMSIDWSSAGKLLVKADKWTLDGASLEDGKNALASAKTLEVTGVTLDVPARSMSADAIRISQPKASVERGKDKRWMFERWMVVPAAEQARAKSPEAASQPASIAASSPAKAAPDPWKMRVADISIDGGSVSYKDEASAKVVALNVSAINMKLKNVDPFSSTPSPAKISARVASGNTEPGSLNFDGRVAMSPLVVQGQIKADHLPLHALEPYYAGSLNIEVIRADASFTGQLRFAQAAKGIELKVTGDSRLEDFRANTLYAADGVPVQREELLRWKALNLRGIAVAVAPGTTTTVDVAETALSDFFARLIINPTGRINLQDLVRKGDSSPSATPVASAASASAPQTAASQPSAQSADGPSPVVKFGPIQISNGRVAFSDRFVKPNYSANLTELQGKLSAFSSVSTDMADLEVRGRAEGSASLEILGKLNPLAKPIALDIQGKVRDLELPALSPYSVKYAGYGIERGKLSLDVNYLVKPDGQLTASNRLVLNQLTFGEKVEGSATNLPVKLAVALLSDRNGVIDVELPISGSLNDPNFSMGGVIVRVIVNLIVKAVTAPFSLLANAFGGGTGDQTGGAIAFAPGSDRLDAKATDTLDKIAKAMTDRPQLQMTITGSSSLEAEREGYKRERLNRRVEIEKRRQLAAANRGGDAAAPVPRSAASAPQTVVTPDEYPALVTEVYKRTDMQKPRNLIGMAKEVSQAEMESMLMAQIVVNDETMRDLATRRAVEVREYLNSKQLPNSRIFLGAIKTLPAGSDKAPGAELSLSTR